jgi:hypothetical protein
MSMYKCFSSDFEELTKKINRITKKLDKNNLTWKFNKISETVEEVRVYDYTNYDNIPAWQFTPEFKGSTPIDVTTYNFEMEELKLGEYEVIAVLEHNAVAGTTENVIHIVKENAIIPTKYRTVKSICEHCNSDRQRNKTVLLQDAQGNIKQVGTTCIKEYTGIEAEDIIKAYQDIHDIIIDNNNLSYDFTRWNKKTTYIKTIDYLTACIELINKEGYNKETTKCKAWENAQQEQQNNKYQETAQQVINYFKNAIFTESQDFLNNIKIYLSQEYTKQSGFIAYAYLAYNKQIEYEAKKKAEQEQNVKSEYVGNIGDKIQTELTLISCYNYETSYNGYNTTTQTIYLFVDKNGNIYKWNTAKFLEKQVGNYLEPVKINDNCNES